MLLTTRKKAPNTFHRHQPGFCKVHSFKNKIAFYEAIPFLFHLSGRFAKNNLNFMQRQLRGGRVSPPPGKQARPWGFVSASRGHPPPGGLTACSPEWPWWARHKAVPALGVLMPLQSGEGPHQRQPPGGRFHPAGLDTWFDPISEAAFKINLYLVLYG